LQYRNARPDPQPCIAMQDLTPSPA
jgi:hypothetical protein